MTQEELRKRAEEAAREVYTYTFQGMDDLIGLFLAGYEQAQKDLGWVSVKERLPEPSQVILTCININGNPRSFDVKHYKDDRWESWISGDHTRHVDYWMPIPGFRKEEQ